jgi:hypothetical protein
MIAKWRTLHSSAASLTALHASSCSFPYDPIFRIPGDASDMSVVSDATTALALEDVNVRALKNRGSC